MDQLKTMESLRKQYEKFSYHFGFVRMPISMLLCSFQKDDTGYVNVYIGDWCENNDQYDAKAAFGVYFGPNNQLNLSMPVTGIANSNAAMLQAATAAIEMALWCGLPMLCIRTDSEFLLNAVQHWIPRWKQNGWVDADGDDVEAKNRKNCHQLDAVMSRFYLPIKWEKVRADNCDKECAVLLAKQCSQMYRPYN